MSERDRVMPKGRVAPTVKDCSKCCEWFATNLQSSVCRLCVNEKRRADWGDAKRDKYKAYEKTHKGFLMRLYRNMESRITGVQKSKHHLYKGKELLPREEFYAWVAESPEFFVLFKGYEESGYERKLAPSVDRIESSLGYSISNMEWVTMSENSRRGNSSRFKERTKYTFTNPEGVPVTFSNMAEFCTLHGLSTGCMYRVKRGDQDQHRGWSL